MKSLQIKNKVIGKDAPMFVIAEIASAHEGDFSNLKKLIDIAAVVKADGVKFQVFNAEAHMTPAHPNYKLSHQLAFSQQQWLEAVAYARSKGDLVILADIYDEESLATVALMDVDIVKIHSADLANYRLIKKVAKLQKPTMMGVGASTLEEIRLAVDLYRSENQDGFLMLMHGFQAFPTPSEEMNMNQIKTLEDMFGLPVAFLDHSLGDTPQSLFYPLVAKAIGAVAVEKHIVIDRSLKGIDYESALSVSYFQQLMMLLRETESALGSSSYKPLSEKEKQYRTFMKKTLVATRDICSGEIINEDMVILKRSSPGLSGEKLKDILGLTVKDFIKFNENITMEKLNGRGY